VKASDLFARCLEEEAVEYVFTVPGEENLDLVESLRESRIDLVVTRHEQHAAFMAANYGRLTGRAGVCLATLGPGATNLVTGVAYAQLGGMPLVAITGQKAVRENLQGNFQLVDVVGTLRPLTKWNTSVMAGARIRRCVRHAFKVAEGERPGAVHLELPEDIAAEEVPEVRPHRRTRLRRPVPDDKSVDLAVELLRQGRNPIAIVSAGANRKRVGKQLRAFVEATGIYAVSTQMGKGVLSEDHPLSLFSLGIHGRDYVHAAIEAADLIITIGYNIVEYPPSVWNGGKDKKILHVDFSAAEPDEYYNPTLELVGDISYALWAMCSRLGAVTFENAMLVDVRAEISDRLHNAEHARSYPPSPREIAHDVREVMGREDIISLDNGIYKLWFARMYRAFADNTILLDNALAAMGAGLAGAMTAKLVFPERKVMAICGDGGFMMNSQDLETALRLGLDLVVLILRDEAYGFIRFKQESMGFPDFAMSFGNPDFVKYAEAYGAAGMRVGEGDRLRDVLRRAFEKEGPVLVDCPIDYTDNRELREDLSATMRHHFERGEE
jgi:acetolactate synthase-1/2/3 large subunit